MESQSYNILYNRHIKVLNENVILRARLEQAEQEKKDCNDKFNHLLKNKILKSNPI